MPAQRIENPGLFLLCAFASASWIAVCAGLLGASAAEAQDLVSGRPISFNIPRQPLGSALAAFGAATNLEVIADARLSRGRLSSPVVGAVLPAEGLAALLAGTGLVSHIDGSGNVKIAEKLDVSEQFSPVRSPYASYYASVQNGVLDAVCDQSASLPGGHRLALRIWTTAAGTVERVKLLDTTGDPRRDETLAGAIRGANTGASPPSGFQQPVTLVISPGALHNGGCAGEIRRASR